MEYKYEPKTKTALIAAIREEIKLQGCRANLNCINTSAITNMRELFNKFKSFNGDISEWDVSNVIDMTDMFKGSEFRGDISNWNVDNVESFFPMFSYCYIADEHKPVRFRYNRPADAPLLKGKLNWKDISFTLSADGVCTVSGDLSGEFRYLLSGTECDRLPVRHLIIAEGVTEIGDHAFDKWRNIEELTLPTSLIKIGREAFDGCWNICRINFSEGLQIIDSDAFFPCPVSELRLPNTLTTIGPRAFSNFEHLTELDLPDSLVSVGERAFYCCYSLRSVKLPAKLKHIPECMFCQCLALKHVQMPAELKRIDNYAFDGCSKLKPIELPDTVEYIAPEAFADMSFEEGGLNYSVTNYITNINTCSVSAKAWEGELDIPSSVCHDGRIFTVCGIEFSECDKLTKVRIPNTVSVIPHGAFQNCKSLRSIEIPSSVTTIEAEAFAGCTALKSVVIPDSVSTLSGSAFLNCKSLQSIEIPSSVTTIENFAFSGCIGLRSIVIPDSVKEIPHYLFDGCWRLREVHLGANTTSIGEHAFRNCEFLQHLQIPDSVELIGRSAFEGCVNLVDLNMPTSLKCLETYALEGTPIMKKEGPIYIDHVLCGFEGQLPKHACLKVREGTTLIAEAALRRKGNLESIILPETLETIGYGAFDYCVSLKHAYLPKSLKSIRNEAFDWTAISEVEVPWATPIDIGHSAFPDETVVYVPVGASKAYKAHKIWAEYKIVEKENCASGPISFIDKDTVIVGLPETYRIVLIEKPQRKHSWTLYGVVVSSKQDVDFCKTIKDLLLEAFRDTALFLDWEEDHDFGSAAPLSGVLEYDTHRYAVVDLPEGVSPETATFNGRMYMTDENIYKHFINNEKVEWISLTKN